MKKILMMVSVVGFAALLVNCKKKESGATTVASGAAEVWKCDFKGTNTMNNGDTAPFSWKVTWTETGDKSTITGQGQDVDGQSNTNGSCDGKKCKVHEEYISGSGKGKIYDWDFTYTDAETRNENVYVTTLSGTFASAKEKNDTGKLTAKADCKR